LGHDVCAEEETVGETVEEGCGLLLDLGRGDRIFLELIPRNVEMQMRECRIRELRLASPEISLRSRYSEHLRGDTQLTD